MTSYKEQLKSVLKKDKVLKKIVENTELVSLKEDDSDLYLSMVESILSQQLSSKAAATIIGRFKALFPENYPNAELIIGTDTEILRSAGLSGQKAGYLKSLATFHLENGISFEKLKNMSDEEIINYLLPIKGVGRWTVEMMLIFTLQRPDVFPVDDLVIRQKMIKAYVLTETGKELYKKLHEIASVWSPHRSLVSRFLWKCQL